MPEEPSQPPPSQPPAESPPAQTPPTVAPPEVPQLPGVIAPAGQQLPPTTVSAKRKGLPLVIAGGVLVLAAIVASLFFFVFNNHISAKNVTDAQAAVKSMSSDVSNLADTLTSDTSDFNTVADFNGRQKATQSKLTDAEKQFTILQKSKTLKDAGVDQKFKTLEPKWAAYDTYVISYLKDAQALSLPLLQFFSSIDDLNNNSITTTAQLSSYLANLKSLVAATSAKIDSAKPSLPEDKLGLTGIKAFLNAASDDLTAAQKDLAAGNTDAVYADLLTIDTGTPSSNSTLDQANTQSNSHEEQLDPSTAITGLQSALSNLQDQVSPSSK